MKRILTTLGACVLAIAGGCSKPQGLHAAIAEKPPFLYGNQHLLQQIEDGLNRISTLAETGKRWSVNKEFSPDAINLYVMDLQNVDSEKLAKLSPQLRNLVMSTHDNAIAVPPDVVVMDVALLGKLFQNSFSDLMMLLQKDGKRPEGDNILDILSDYHRIRSMRLDLNLVDDRDREWIEQGYGNHRVFWPYVLEEIDRAQLGAMFSAALAPVLFHELGHLEHGETGHMFPELEQMKRKAKDATHEVSNYLWNGRLKSSEDSADAYSIQRLGAYLANSVGHPPDNGVPVKQWPERAALPPDAEQYQQLLFMASAFLLIKAQESDGQVMERTLVASTGKYFRDEVLTEAFQGFRGFSAENNLFRFYHRACNVDQETNSIEFNRYEDLTRAERGFYPILTKGDWFSIRQKFFEHVSAGTHSHNFYRASAIFGAAQAQTAAPATDAMKLDRGAQLFAALMEDDPTRLEPVFGAATRIPVQRLLYKLSDTMEFEPAVSCAKSICQVGRFKRWEEFGFSSGAVLEIESNSAGNVVFARFVFPLFVVPSEQWQTAAAEKGFARQIMEFAVSTRFVASAFNEDLSKLPIETKSAENSDPDAAGADWAQNAIHNPKTPVERFMRFRSNALKCRAATDRIAGSEDFDMEFRTLSDDLWIGIEILPKAVAAR